MPKMLKVMSHFPPASGHQVLMAGSVHLRSFLHKDDLGLFKPNPKGGLLPSWFLTITQLIPHKFIILLLVLK